jgi:hypothetical protein
MLGRPKSAIDLTAFLVSPGHMLVMRISQDQSVVDQQTMILFLYTGASKELKLFMDDRIANQDLCLLFSLSPIYKLYHSSLKMELEVQEEPDGIAIHKELSTNTLRWDDTPQEQ